MSFFFDNTGTVDQFGRRLVAVDVTVSLAQIAQSYVDALVDRTVFIHQTMREKPLIGFLDITYPVHSHP